MQLKIKEIRYRCLVLILFKTFFFYCWRFLDKYNRLVVFKSYLKFFKFLNFIFLVIHIVSNTQNEKKNQLKNSIFNHLQHLSIVFIAASKRQYFSSNLCKNSTKFIFMNYSMLKILFVYLVNRLIILSKLVKFNRKHYNQFTVIHNKNLVQC